MLDRDDELKLLGFLASLAGLLGVVVSVSNFQIGTASSTTVRVYFSVILVVFMFTAAVAYLTALGNKDVKGINQAVLGFFSTLLGLVAGAAVASQYPIDYQFVGFWITGFILATIIYLAPEVAQEPRMANRTTLRRLQELEIRLTKKRPRMIRFATKFQTERRPSYRTR